MSSFKQVLRTILNKCLFFFVFLINLTGLKYADIGYKNNSYVHIYSCLYYQTFMYKWVCLFLIICIDLCE